MQKSLETLLSPCGRPTSYRYFYRNSEQGILRGHVVSRSSKLYVVLSGVGTRRDSPCVRLLKLEDSSQRTSIVTKLSPICLQDATTCKCRAHRKYQRFCQKEAAEKFRLAHSFVIQD